MNAESQETLADATYSGTLRCLFSKTTAVCS